MNKSLKLPTFQDGTVKFYQFTNLVPPQELADGVRVQATHGLIDRSLLMWRCEEHYKKRVWGEDDKDLGKFYIISWLCYGPGYRGRETVGAAIDYYEKKGWKLAYSEGPKSSPQNIPDYHFNAGSMEYEPHPVYVGERMHKLPKNWVQTNKAVIEEMDRRPSDKQIAAMMEMNKKNTQELIQAFKESQK